MGIDGLLLLLKGVTQHTHISKWKNKRVAVDTLSWLYKGSYATHIDCTDYLCQMVSLLAFYELQPVFVFDGRSLPSKAATLSQRRATRQMNREKAIKLQEAGLHQEAQKLLARCIHISQELLLFTIIYLREKNLPILFAPYEADSQIAHLFHSQLIDFALSEDSDLLLYGVSTAFKLTTVGECDFIDLHKLKMHFLNNKNSVQNLQEEDIQKMDIEEENQNLITQRRNQTWMFKQQMIERASNKQCEMTSNQQILQNQMINQRQITETTPKKTQLQQTANKIQIQTPSSDIEQLASFDPVQEEAGCSQALKWFLEFTSQQRIEAAALSGTDYNDNIRGIGIRTAIALIHDHGDTSTTLNALKSAPRWSVPEDYERVLKQTKLIFCGATVYDPINHRLQQLNGRVVAQNEMQIVGQHYGYTHQVADGSIQCKSLEKRIIPSKDEIKNKLNAIRQEMVDKLGLINGEEGNQVQHEAINGTSSQKSQSVASIIPKTITQGKVLNVQRILLLQRANQKKNNDDQYNKQLWRTLFQKKPVKNKVQQKGEKFDILKKKIVSEEDKEIQKTQRNNCREMLHKIMSTQIAEPQIVEVEKEEQQQEDNEEMDELLRKLNPHFMESQKN